MEILRIVILALGSIIILFALTKIMGNRQMSQLSMFDYINGITIGSIAAEMAIDLENFYKPLVAMVTYALAATLISYISCKSIKVRSLVMGKPLILFEEGKFYVNNLLKAKLDAGEFLTQCRNIGYFNLSNVHSAILEPNGRLSILPVSTQRPVTPGDLSLSPTQEKPMANVIVDGKMVIDNMQAVGIGEGWLREQLNMQGVTDIAEIFLATCDTDHVVSIYKSMGGKASGDAMS